MERLDTSILGKSQKILLGISAKHMSSYEVESIPTQVTYIDSHTQRGKFSQVSTVIPRGHVDPLDLVLAQMGARRILQEPTTLINGWDLILDYLK